MSTSPRLRNEWIDATKGLCILMVVLHHYVQLAYQPDFPVLQSTWNLVDRVPGPLRMPVFFFVSGVLARHYVAGLSFADIWRRRILQLLWWFIAFGVIQWTAIYLIDLNNLPGHLSTTRTVPIDAIYADSPAMYLVRSVSGYSSLWYLYALPVYLLISKAGNCARALTTCGVLTVYCISFAIPVDLGWGPESLLRNAIFFLLGAYWGAALIHRCQHPSTVDVICFAALILFAIFFYSHGYRARFIGSFPAVGLTIWAMHRADFLLNGRVGLYVQYLGRHTLNIYVIHRIFIELLSGPGLANGAAIPWQDPAVVLPR